MCICSRIETCHGKRRAGGRSTKSAQCSAQHRAKLCAAQRSTVRSAAQLCVVRHSAALHATTLRCAALCTAQCTAQHSAAVCSAARRSVAWRGTAQQRSAAQGRKVGNLGST